MTDGTHTPNRRILVIDDNRDIHKDFRKIFSSNAEHAPALAQAEGRFVGGTTTVAEHPVFEFDSAFQGQEGLELIRRSLEENRLYAMAFVEARMPPGWDGIETIARIWQEYPDLQVVVCTAYSDYSWAEMIGKVGQSDQLVILKKPFDHLEVLQLAKALTEKWRLLQEARRQKRDLEAIVQERTEERKLLEVQLRHAQKLESIGQLSAGIAHEINTPTQFIGDNTRFVRHAFVDLQRLMDMQEKFLEAARSAAITPELIAQVEQASQAADLEYLSTEIPKALDQTLEGIHRVSKIVNAMKDFSHPGTGSKTMLDLNQAIENTLTVCRNEWKYVADLVTNLDPALPPVPVLPGEFNQVILNIIINAAHAIADTIRGSEPTKGVITISTQRKGDWAEIAIRDTGAGIPERVRGRIFDPFFTTSRLEREPVRVWPLLVRWWWTNTEEP
jgi:two-component system NtrC family sensor kinase